MVLTEHFLPQKGGSINWLLNTYGRYKSGEVVFVASCCQGDRLTDQNLPFNVERIGLDHGIGHPPWSVCLPELRGLGWATDR